VGGHVGGRRGGLTAGPEELGARFAMREPGRRSQRHGGVPGGERAHGVPDLVAAAGIGVWAATSGDDAGASPQDPKSSAPASP
ncbi:hypothetical protein AB0O75_34630, partial [Streptomyces sp. NPDC088921]